MPKFTVLMLNTDATDAIVEHVECAGPDVAHAAALRMRWEEGEPEPDAYPFDADDAAEDNPLLAVFEGHLMDVQPVREG